MAGHDPYLPPSDRQLPTRTDSNMHGLLPHGPHNIRANDSRDSQEGRLHRSEPETGAGLGPEIRAREIRLPIWSFDLRFWSWDLHFC